MTMDQEMISMFCILMTIILYILGFMNIKNNGGLYTIAASILLYIICLIYKII